MAKSKIFYGMGFVWKVRRLRRGGNDNYFSINVLEEIVPRYYSA
jgi:hypothetical protein